MNQITYFSFLLNVLQKDYDHYKLCTSYLLVKCINNRHTCVDYKNKTELKTSYVCFIKYYFSMQDEYSATYTFPLITILK